MFLRSSAALAVVIIFTGIMQGPAQASKAAPPAANATRRPQTSSAAADDPCGADTDLLATLSRPTVGFSPCAVKPRRAVLEFGYANEITSGSTVGTNVTYPQGFLRLGTGPNLEFDIIGPAYNATLQGSSRANGFSDSGVGMKWEFFHDAQTVLAVDGLLTLATGDAQFTTGSPTETVNIDLSRNLTPNFSFGATVGYSSLAGADGTGMVRRYATWLPSAAVSVQPTKWTQMYLEAYGVSRLGPSGGTKFALDGGLQFLAGPNLELDLEAGRTVTGASRSHYIGFGTGIKF